MLTLRSLSPTTKARRFALAVLSLAAVAGMAIADAEARPGRSGSVGSRGDRTFSTPPTTNTAPKPAAPVEKSMTQPGKATAAAPAAAGAATAAAQTAGKSSMMRNLLMGGLIGAGLASLFGMGGSFAAILGFLLQTLLIAGLVVLAVGFIRSRMQPAAAAAQQPGRPVAREALQPAGLNAGVGGGSGAVGAGPAGTVAVQPADFDAFERLLGEIQTAYGREDVDALGDRTTPEMLSYFAGELHENKTKGVINKISGIKLLQGDLSEAWREQGAEYATVAMRYAITDEIVDRASGRRVDGSGAGEATELWTFVRRTGAGTSGWQLSAIQQA